MHSLADDLTAPGPGFVPADRVARLGTETVFAVSAEAAALAAQGRTIYPFHLGDLNIPTAEPIVEAMKQAIRDGKTTYCPNAGIAPLREALAADVGAARGVTYAADDVSVQPGGKPVIGKFLMAAMNGGDEVLYPNPGFPIYASFIEFVGGVAVPYGFVDAGDRYTVDIDAMERAHHAEDAPAHPQRPAQPDGRRVHAGGARPHRRDRDQARPARAQRRGVLRRALRGREPVDRLAPRHEGAHGHPVHVQQEVRDDGLAPRRRRRPPGPSSTSSRA